MRRLLPKYVVNSARNAALAALGRLDAAAAYPIDCCFLVTWRCNLRCTYCYESAAPRTLTPALSQGERETELDTAGVCRALAGIREVVDVLVLSGGEPTTRPDLVEIHELGFAETLLNTNLVDLPDLEFLDHVDQVLVGLDALTEEGFCALTRGTSAQYHRQQENLETLLRLRAERRFDVCFSSVLCADRLDEVDRILEFCQREGVLVAFSPHVADLSVVPQLRGNAEYREVARRLCEGRKRGLPLMGSPAYYRSIQEFGPFRCIPMANLTVEPDGRMRWPCGEARPAGRSFADGLSWKLLMEAASAEAGSKAPTCVGKCHFGCRLALSSLVNAPWEFPGEALHLLRYKRHSR